MGGQSFVIQGNTLQLCAKHVFIIRHLHFGRWVNELFWQFILKEADMPSTVLHGNSCIEKLTAVLEQPPANLD